MKTDSGFSLQTRYRLIITVFLKRHSRQYKCRDYDTNNEILSTYTVAPSPFMISKNLHGHNLELLVR
jgi:hypothetical protein